MSYTHDRDITLEGWIVHTSQANAKGTIKEHRNPILESRCKSKNKRMIARSAASFISGFDFADVEVVKDGVHYANRMILGNKVTNARRKKKKIVLSVRFI